MKNMRLSFVWALSMFATACAHQAPLRLSPAWSAQGESRGNDFGLRAMTAGDVDKDGYDDLLVGAPHFEAGRGRAYLYRGGPQGLAAKPFWQATGGSAELFADRVGQAGDLNGDGYADIFVAAPGYQTGLGRCAVYYGGPKGPPAKASWQSVPKDYGTQFADCTHPTGDINGDGYDDLAVGAYGFKNSRGRLQLFLGGPQGLGKKAAWERHGEADFDWYGYGVGAAGDVNGDGFDDLLAGAKYNDEAGHDAGKAYLYLGSKQGLGDAVWTFTGKIAEANTSMRVTTLGDVNGDGRTDVMVTAPGTAGNVGKLYVFFGGPQGLAKDPDQTIDGRADGWDFFGQGACPAGDLDGDGYDDVAVHGRGALGLGSLLIYRGSRKGLQSFPGWRVDGETPGDRFAWWVAPAGDVDGDGAPDLVVSAESHEAGKVYVLYGKQFCQGSPKPRKARLKGYLRK